ncbi:MAG: CDP-alcohol phosphatidyltransferase family protein [Pirellulales bacterium]
MFSEPEFESEIDPKSDSESDSKSVPKVTCYSEGDGEFMHWSQALRGRLLTPFLVVMARAGISPNHLTLLSLATGLGFCPVFIWSSKPVAFGLLVLHVLLDGLDGPLARYSNNASNKGSFTDTTSDQVVVTSRRGQPWFQGRNV